MIEFLVLPSCKNNSVISSSCPLETRDEKRYLSGILSGMPDPVISACLMLKDMEMWSLCSSELHFGYQVLLQ